MSESNELEKQLSLYSESLNKLAEEDFDIHFDVTPSNAYFAQFESDLLAFSKWMKLRFDENDKVRNIIAEISKGSGLNDVLLNIFESFDEIIPYDRIGCALFNEQNGKLETHWVKTKYSHNIKLSTGYTARLTNSSLTKLLQDRHPRIINDLQQYLNDHPESKSSQLLVAEGIQSSLTCPLISDHKSLGFLFFSSKETNTYLDCHQRVFVTLSRQISLLIEKSQLYEQVNSLNSKLFSALDQIKEQSSRDPLTGIYHRGTVSEFLIQSLTESSRTHRPVSVLMVDLDYFKIINDSFGHGMGDKVLKAAADTISNKLRDYDCVGRYGGEEFLIVLRDTDAMAAFIIAERIRRAISHIYFNHPHTEISVSASIGVSSNEKDFLKSADFLVEEADEAMYRAKRDGRNKTRMSGV
jgi:diguanylate cyclase (GGDEF)-like protein